MTPPEVRIGDAERDGAVGALGEHYAAGRLTKEEYDDRSASAWSAKTLSALRPLFADLPAPHGPLTPAVPPRAPVGPARRQPARSGRRIRFPVFALLLAVLFVALVLGEAGWLVFWVALAWFFWGRRCLPRRC